MSVLTYTLLQYGVNALSRALVVDTSTSFSQYSAEIFCLFFLTELGFLAITHLFQFCLR